MCGIDQRRKIKDVSVGGENKKERTKERNLCSAAFGRSVSLTTESKPMRSTAAWREREREKKKRKTEEAFV